MEDAPNGVEVITHRAVSRLREQNDFPAGLNSNCTGKLIAHRDGFGLPIVQVTASYYLALKCGDISFAIGVDPQKLHTVRSIRSPNHAVAVYSGSSRLDARVDGDLR